MQEDEGSQENWDKIHKQALYWKPIDSIPLQSPSELRQ